MILTEKSVHTFRSNTTSIVHGCVHIVAGVYTVCPANDTDGYHFAIWIIRAVFYCRCNSSAGAQRPHIRAGNKERPF